MGGSGLTALKLSPMYEEIQQVLDQASETEQLLLKELAAATEDEQAMRLIRRIERLEADRTLAVTTEFGMQGELGRYRALSSGESGLHTFGDSAMELLATTGCLRLIGHLTKDVVNKLVALTCASIRPVCRAGTAQELLAIGKLVQYGFHFQYAGPERTGDSLSIDRSACCAGGIQYFSLFVTDR